VKPWPLIWFRSIRHLWRTNARAWRKECIVCGKPARTIGRLYLGPASTLMYGLTCRKHMQQDHEDNRRT